MKTNLVARVAVTVLGSVGLANSAVSVPETPRYHWDTVPIGGGGYVTDVYCHPKQKDLVYIRTDVGGFYRWNPKHPGWIPLMDNLTRDNSNWFGGEGMALDPTDPKVVYVAAGKWVGSVPKGTIFKSNDRGNSWTKLPVDLDMGGNMNYRWGGQRLSVSPFHPSVVMFGSRNQGLYESSNAGKSWYHMTEFPGVSKRDGGINAIAFDLKQPGHVVAAEIGDGLFESKDDGLNWARIPNGPSEVQRLAAGPDGAIYATCAAGILRWKDGAWTDISPIPADKSAQFSGISVDLHNPKSIIATTQTKSLRLFRTLDGGKTWTEKKYKTESSVPWYSGQMRDISYVAGIALDPIVPGRAWLTDWYATYLTRDIDAPTITLENHESGHEEVVAFCVAAPPVGEKIYAGTADVDGFQSSDFTHFARGFGDFYHGKGVSSGYTWQVSWCASQPNILVRASASPWSHAGEPSISHNSGATWAPFPAWDRTVMPGRISLSCKKPGNMVAIPVGNSPVLVSVDSAHTWKSVQGLPQNMILNEWNWTVPLAADGARDGVFYVCTGGRLYRSVDGGQSFAAITIGLPTNGAIVQTVPGSAGELWIAFDSGGLFHSVNSGDTIHKIEGVSDASLFAAGMPAPGSKTPTYFLYGRLTGGKDGIYRSDDGARSWINIQDPKHPVGDEPNCMAGSYQTFGQVFIGTNGRGIWHGEPDRTKERSSQL